MDADVPICYTRTDARPLADADGTGRTAILVRAGMDECSTPGGDLGVRAQEIWVGVLALASFYRRQRKRELRKLVSA